MVGSRTLGEGACWLWDKRFWGDLFLEARFGARLASRAPNQLLEKSDARFSLRGGLWKRPVSLTGGFAPRPGPTMDSIDAKPAHHGLHALNVAWCP